MPDRVPTAVREANRRAQHDLAVSLGRSPRPDNALVHERDRLRDEVERLTKLVADLEAGLRHHVRLTCDRCRSLLIVASSLETPDQALSAGLEIAACEAGWSVSKATAVGLDARVLVVSDADRCPHCVKALGAPV